MPRIIDCKRGCGLILVGLVCVVGVTLGFDTPVSAQVSDDFSAPELDRDLWQLVDPRGDGEMLFSPGLITLRIPTGLSHNAGATANNTLRLVQDLPDADFSLEARFESLPAVRGQQQGLMVLQDAGSHVRLLHYHNGEQLKLAWARTVAHQVQERGELAVTASDTLSLRLTRQGNQWTAAQAVDGGAWSTAFVFDQGLQVTQGGVYAATMQPASGHFPYDREDSGGEKAADGAPAPGFAAVVDYVFDADNPIVPEDGALQQTSRTFADLETFYLFRAAAQGVVFDYAGGPDPYHLTQLDTTAVSWLPDQGLRLETPSIVTAQRPATTLNEAIRAAGAVTLEAWLDPLLVDQYGPARILTLSIDPGNRNVSLSHGQWGSLPGDLVDVRLRTTEQTLNGQPDLVSPAGSLSGDLQHVVYTRDASGATRIYVDGIETVAGVTGGSFANWDLTYPLALGGEMDDSRHWLGTLYLAAIYSRALDATEVAANFAAGPDGGALPDLLPHVKLQDVLPGATHVFTDTIAMGAVADDADGTIESVEFRANDVVLFRDETAPFQFGWANPPVGNHLLQAVALDNSGHEAISDVVPISVSAPASYALALAESDAFFDADLGEPWTLTDTSGGAAANQSNGSVLLTLPSAIQTAWDPDPAVLRADQAEIDTDLALELMIDGDAWLGDGFAGLEMADSLGASLRFVASRDDGIWTLSWGAAAAGPATMTGALTLGAISGPVWLEMRRHGDLCDLFHTTATAVHQATATLVQPLDLNRSGWLVGALNGPATVALDHAFNLARPIIPEDGESADTSGPVISQLTEVTDFDELRLSWVTDEPAYYQLEYGLTTAYELGQIDGGFLNRTHQAVLSGLAAGQAYHIRLTCVDDLANRTVTGDLVYYTDLIATSAPGPAAGDVYREIAIGIGAGNDDWRVTDPDATNSGAATYLPNPVLTIEIPDLTGAVRAELVLDRWGGHPGTSGKKLRVRGGSWLHLPEIASIPDDQPECYMSQDNPIIALPLAQLASGFATLEGTADRQVCANFGWGQWGLYGVVIRVYYDETVAHPDASILAPAPGDTITDSASIVVDATSAGAVDRVHVLAKYDGQDTDGDGVTGTWHRRYRRDRSSAALRLEGIVGTATAAPWNVTWDVDWLPDQMDGNVALQARVRDAAGVWSVSEIDSLYLNHSDGVVKLYTLQDVPQVFWVRAGQIKSATFDIPVEDDLTLASEALLAAATWNGSNDGVIDINGGVLTDLFGQGHFYDYDFLNVDPLNLAPGINTLSITSDTSEHGPEFLWPGPQLAVRYGVAAPPAPLSAGSGDVDRNGRVDGQDARLVLAHIVGAAPLSGAARARADRDGNGRIDVRDARLLASPETKGDAAAAAKPRMVAAWDQASAAQLHIGLAGTTGTPAVELMAVADGLETALRDLQLSVEPRGPWAWHAAGDTLRLAFTAAALAPESITLDWHTAPAGLQLSGVVDAAPVEPLSVSAADLPARFELVGNYPNPFNPTTTIAFNLPRSADVRLRVHDVRGRIVATVVDGRLPAGRHQMPWDGRDQQGRTVASGTFFYRLETAGQAWTRKMTLLK